MLTPIDQPLDKLEDLKPDEMCVFVLLKLHCSDPSFSDNMKSWIDHFSNKYIICGKLVGNDQA
jgi:membrane-associated progesterone receptor component